MRRTGLFLMAIFLAAPMLRECCLPAVVLHSCHQSTHAGNEWCSANQEAIAESRSTPAFFPVHFGFPATDATSDSGHFDSTNLAADELALARTHTLDLYIRTGALLI